MADGGESVDVAQMLLQALLENDKNVKVAKLTENDIEAYLMTFEILMLAYEVKKEK